MVARLVYIYWLFAFFAAPALGWEVDNFTQRYESLPDANAELSAEVNRHLQSALKSTNRDSLHACDKGNMYHAVVDELAGWIVGSLEHYAKQSSTVARHEEQYPSIYALRDTSTKAHGIILTVAGLDPSINLNGYYIGVDKFGHFFDEGQDYFEIYKANGSNTAAINKAIDHGIKLEEGVYGWSTTGVKSYGDASASFSGLWFWNSLVEGDNPYFKCEQGAWKQVRQFNWADYANSSWDEAVNCNVYNRQQMADGVQDRGSQLEAEARRSGTNYKFICPVSANECVKLQKKYGAWASKILSPKCLNAVADTSTLPVSGQRAGAGSADVSGGGRK